MSVSLAHELGAAYHRRHLLPLAGLLLYLGSLARNGHHRRGEKIRLCRLLSRLGRSEYLPAWLCRRARYAFDSLAHRCPHCHHERGIHYRRATQQPTPANAAQNTLAQIFKGRDRTVVVLVLRLIL
jgi:hypothetical protein